MRNQNMKITGNGSFEAIMLNRIFIEVEAELLNRLRRKKYAISQEKFWDEAALRLIRRVRSILFSELRKRQRHNRTIKTS